MKPWDFKIGRNASWLASVRIMLRVLFYLPTKICIRFGEVLLSLAICIGAVAFNLVMCVFYVLTVLTLGLLGRLN